MNFSRSGNGRLPKLMFDSTKFHLHFSRSGNGRLPKPTAAGLAGPAMC